MIALISINRARPIDRNNGESRGNALYVSAKTRGRTQLVTVQLPPPRRVVAYDPNIRIAF